MTNHPRRRKAYNDSPDDQGRYFPIVDEQGNPEALVDGDAVYRIALKLAAAFIELGEATPEDSAQLGATFVRVFGGEMYYLSSAAAVSLFAAFVVPRLKTLAAEDGFDLGPAVHRVLLEMSVASEDGLPDPEGN